MANITIQVPDAHMPRVIDALCQAGGWTEAHGPRPVFAKEQVTRWIRDLTLSVERARFAAEAAAAAAHPEDLEVAAPATDTEDLSTADLEGDLTLDDNPALHSNL